VPEHRESIHEGAARADSEVPDDARDLLAPAHKVDSVGEATRGLGEKTSGDVRDAGRERGSELFADEPE
jgi:hypothetical protein